MSDPFPAAAPPTFEEENTVQLKVVPATPLGFVMATLAFVAEQIVLSEAATSGIGKKVI
jgi:hypothetical protein